MNISYYCYWVISCYKLYDINYIYTTLIQNLYINIYMGNIMLLYIHIYIYIWLLVWNMFYFFHNIWDNASH